MEYQNHMVDRVAKGRVVTIPLNNGGMGPLFDYVLNGHQERDVAKTGFLALGTPKPRTAEFDALCLDTRPPISTVRTTSHAVANAPKHNQSVDIDHRYDVMEGKGPAPAIQFG